MQDQFPEYPNGSKVLFQNKIWTVIRKPEHFNDIYLKDSRGILERWCNYEWDLSPIPIQNYKRIELPVLETFEFTNANEDNCKYLRTADGIFEVKKIISACLHRQMNYYEHAVEMRNEDLLHDFVRLFLKYKL